MTDDDHDFYTYRIYYKLNSAIVDNHRQKHSGFGGAPYNLGLITANAASIEGLVPLESYDYFMRRSMYSATRSYTLIQTTYCMHPRPTHLKITARLNTAS
jgi:hypothetical protein